jgi:hypothetical protein
MTNLVTLDEYKIAENIQSVKDDTRISTLITSVSALVRTYCGNSILSATHTEDFSINWGTNLVQLTESPVNSIVYVNTRNSYADSYTGVPASEYFLEKSTDSVYSVTRSGVAKNWPTGPASVQIQYTAGYASCPEDLKLAVFDLITYYLKDEHKARQTLAGASIQNQSSSSQRNNVAFPDHIKRVLDLYKNF